ncbi:MAG: SPOR domain-containing protein [Pseudomonadales bacterium]
MHFTTPPAVPAFPKVCAALLFCALALSGCDRQEAAWQEAQATDTAAAYQAYLEEHGDSPQAVEAEQRIRALQRTKLWEEARQADTADAYRRFLEQFPDADRAEQARERLSEIERQTAWERLRGSSDIAALRAFVETQPGDPLAEQARQRVSALTAEAERQEQARREEERQRRLAEEAAYSHRVQLAALRTEQQARSGADGLKQRFADILGKTDLELERSGNYYLVRTVPLSADDAHSLCERLKAKNQDCLVVGR